MLKNRILFQILTMALLCNSQLASASIPQRILNDLKVTEVIETGVLIEAPDIAESGGEVPVTIRRIETGKDDVYVTELHLYSDNRQQVVERILPGRAIIPQDISTRIKLAGTTKIYVLAKLSNGKVIAGEKLIKVTMGGCGDASSGFLTQN